jgi:hypothetical protein
MMVKIMALAKAMSIQSQNQVAIFPMKDINTLTKDSMRKRRELHKLSIFKRRIKFLKNSRLHLSLTQRFLTIWHLA